jgi:hypothetical protein
VTRLLGFAVGLALLAVNGGSLADQPARHKFWDWGGGLGGGGFVGRGSDANRLGASAMLTLGYRLKPLWSLRGLALMKGLSLTTERLRLKDYHSGKFSALAVNPSFHLLGPRTGLELNLGPVVGYGIMIGALEGRRSELVFTSRASFFGVTASALWNPSRWFAVGVMGTGLELNIHEACIQVHSGMTYCDVFGAAKPHLVLAHLIFRARL